MNHHYNRRLIALCTYDVRAELRELAESVQNMFPVGSRVEYQHGDRWVGPCTVTSVDERCSDYFGPIIMLLNDKTGKRPPRMTASRIRHLGENWDGFQSAWLLEQDIGS